MIDRESIFNFSRTELTAEDFVDKPVVIEAENLKSGTLDGVSFKIHEGELVGIGGLRGQGQRELLLSLFGAERYSGTIRLFGRKSGSGTRARQ